MGFSLLVEKVGPSNCNTGTMPVTVGAPSQSLLIEVQPLLQQSFVEFGTVIENPEPTSEPTAEDRRLPLNAVRANQGTAVKYQDVTDMLDLYSSAPSKVASKAVMNMFVCAPRDLRRETDGDRSIQGLEGTFLVEILERHPFTTQTFLPLGLSTAEEESARYLVIVAPSHPPSREDEHLPVPLDGVSDRSRYHLPGRGLPNLAKLRAFIAMGSQAVTYGAGTWHAPMVVIGKKPIDFVVVQFSNGVEVEDCQEAVLKYPNDQASIRVAIRDTGLGQSRSNPAKL